MSLKVKAAKIAIVDTNIARKRFSICKLILRIFEGSVIVIFKLETSDFVGKSNGFKVKRPLSYTNTGLTIICDLFQQFFFVDWERQVNIMGDLRRFTENIKELKQSAKDYEKNN